MMTTPSRNRPWQHCRVLNPLLFLFLLLISYHVPVALACGGFACVLAQPVVQSGEAIVFGVQGTRVEMHVQILYEGPAEEFGWLLPLPYMPELSSGSDVLFKALFDTTAPSYVMEIDETASATCGGGPMDVMPCAAMAGSAMDKSSIVLEQGSVGPFDYAILEAQPNDPSVILQWLEDNSYQVPDNSNALLNFYAMQDHVFVALKLQKDTDAGEITPLILTYDMAEDDTTDESTTTTTSDSSLTTAMTARRVAMACVPLQMTSIAATNNMPIQVYVLADARAVPLNYIELELDDRYVDWLGCHQNPGCYYADHLDRFHRAANELVNHTFVTEFAGSAAVMQNQVTVSLTKDELLERQNDLESVLFQLPDIRMVTTLVDQYRAGTLSATDLIEALDEKVLQPAQQAQAFVDRFAYLTRLYARLSPETMTRDPFFTLDANLPDVSNVHRATAVPICQDEDGTPVALSILAAESSSSQAPITVPAMQMCGRWMSAPPVELPSSASSLVIQINDDGSVTPLQSLAKTLTAHTLPSPMTLERNDAGQFDTVAIQDLVAAADAQVVNQTIPSYTPASSSTGGSTIGTNAGSTGSSTGTSTTSSSETTSHRMALSLLGTVITASFLMPSLFLS